MSNLGVYHVQVMQRLNKLWSIVTQNYPNYTILSFPRVNYNLRGRVAGKAFCTFNNCGDVVESEVRLNAQLLIENQQSFIDRTVGHELAHIVAYQLYGKEIKPHGREWKMVMKMFGQEPSRCHSFDVSNVSTRKTHTYECGCRTFQLTSVRHNKIIKGKSSYTCNRCKGTLRLLQKAM
jgi:SprT protein